MIEGYRVTGNVLDELLNNSLTRLLITPSLLALYHKLILWRRQCGEGKRIKVGGGNQKEKGKINRE